MSSTYGDNLKLSIFGQSHASAIGMTLDGIPAGLKIDTNQLAQFLERRAPGRNAYSTSRKEADMPQFLCGIQDDYTCGAPICAVIYNTNTRSTDYSNIKDCPRPGHADYTAEIKYGGYQDVAGGGHFSGRLTAPLCIAGGLCKQWLEEMGIEIGAHILNIHGQSDYPFNPMNPQINDVLKDFPVLNNDCKEKMLREIEMARTNGDSVGGIIECAVNGLPVGIGEPMFGGLESKIASIVYGIPAVKCVEFGIGSRAALLFGSECNDPFTMNDGHIETETNNSGGILGGISNGMPLIFRATVKPTPSIAKAQQSISFSQQINTQLSIHGRHDPCIVPRAVPVVEAATAIAIYDLILGNTQAKRRKE